MAINFGDVLDAVSVRRSSEPALTSDEGTLSWSEFSSRTNALARGLLALGLKPGDKVGFYLYNSASYVEMLAACFIARLVHVNINFRYLTSELDYVLRDVDVAALVYDGRLAEKVQALPVDRQRHLTLIVDGEAGGVGGAIPLEMVREGMSGALLDAERSGEDYIFICTGGTTGHPKAVMWEQADLARALLRESLGSESRDHTVDDLMVSLEAPKPFLSPLIASPLMHGAGLMAVLTTFSNGGHVIVTDNGGPFDAGRHWDLVERYRADAVGIVGDAFAKPLLGALAERSRDLGCLKMIGSSGVMWSMPVKQALLEYLPDVALVDSLGSTEAMGLGASIMTKDGVTETARFRLGANCVVFDENNEQIPAGSTRVGYLARSGPMPRGYYNDPEKTARTFREVEGIRYCFSGDMCRVDTDGTINLLGRGSACINTGGEKVFPEEVEEALKLHPDVADALVFGVDDPKWGQAVSAIIRLRPAGSFDADAVRAYLRHHLSPYKIPKKIGVTEQAIRKANGKADYARAREIFSELA